MASLAQKRIFLQILGEQYSSSELLESFEVVKYLFGKFAKKIYTGAYDAVGTSLPPAVATVLSLVSKFDHCDAKGIQTYISMVKKQQSFTLDELQIGEEHASVVYTKGDEIYKRSLGRDLEKLLAKQ